MRKALSPHWTRIAWIAWLLGNPVPAQINTASLYGLVADPAGAAVVGALVTLISEDTQASREAASNERGEFVFTFLPVGRYQLVIRAKGFNEYRRQGLVLNAAEVARATFTLRVGDLKESVTITAELPVLNAVSTQQLNTLTTSQVRELPTGRRNWTALLQADTAVNVTGGNVSMNGLPPAGFNFTIDGTNGTSNPEQPSMAMFGGFNIVRGVSLEAIEEVSVVKGIAPADVASTLSGNVNLITKSGSNQFRGTLFWLNQLDEYNARNQFLATRPGLTFNQYGGSAGGPIVKNRLFYHGAAEIYEERSFRAIQGNVPTADFRSRAIAAVPGYRAILELFPLPNTPHVATAVNAQFIGAGSANLRDRHVTARGDYQIRDGHLLSLRYTRGRPFQITPHISRNERSFAGISESGNANYTHTRAAFTTQTRFGYNRNIVQRTDNRFRLGIPNISGAIGFSGGGAEHFYTAGSVLTAEQAFSFVRGPQSLKAGFLFQRNATGRDNEETPVFNYSTVDDFLANVPGSVQFTFGVRPFQIRTSQFGFFVQDDIKLTQRLIINLGVRYDYFTVPAERDGRLFNRKGPFGTGGDLPSGNLFRADRNNFAPRAGFAWSVDANSRTVVRAGFGLFVSPHTILGGPVDTVQNSATEPFRITLSRAEAQRLNVRYPFTNAQARPITAGPAALNSNAAIDEFFPNPYSIQWMASVQRQFTATAGLEVAYVANRGLRLNMVREMNLPDRITGVRPFAGFGQFRYYDKGDMSTFHSLQTSFRKRLSGGLLFNVNYTYANNISLGSADLLLSDRPQDNFNTRADRGPTPYDIRHRFITDYVYEPPFDRWLGKGLARRVLGGWQAGGLIRAQTGGILNVTQPTAFPGSRVDYLGGEAIHSNWRETLVYLNRSVFATVPIVAASGAAMRPGNLGRGALREPGLLSFDFSLSKNVAFTERYRLQLRADLFNGFNRTNFTGLATSIAAGNFGRLTSANARTMQVNLRLQF